MVCCAFVIVLVGGGVRGWDWVVADWRICECAESEAEDKACLGFVEDDGCVLRVFQVCC